MKTSIKKRTLQFTLAFILTITALFATYKYFSKNTGDDILKRHDKTKNFLQNQASPYLLQHASNPTLWYPYVKQALKKAKLENKMLFISVGYSTCHWCHVMEEESYENEEVAKILNKHFVSIKIDREEMPHLDSYYMSVYQMLNRGGGGWPLNIIASPENKPFYGFTYLPREDKQNYSGLLTLLDNIVQTFQTNPQKIKEVSLNLDNAMKKQNNGASNVGNESLKSLFDDANNNGKISKEKTNKIVQKFVSSWDKRLDKVYGGLSGSPKFPSASSLNTLLDIYSLTNNKQALDMAVFTLEQMAMGGIHDQIEGGFYRYSVDNKWRIPHFEKMLYTNSELLEAYNKAYIHTNNDYFKQVALGIISSVKTRFKQDNNLYFSASDADSALEFERFDKHKVEKEEGYYFVFSYDELEDIVSEDIIKYFNITPDGNFEFKNNPYLSKESLKNKPPQAQLDEGVVVMKKIRASKPYPFIDYKILLSWNSLYIKSLLGAKNLDKIYLDDGLKSVDALIDELYVDGVLYHQKVKNKELTNLALFEDYSFFISLLLVAYDESLDDKYLKLSTLLAKEAIVKFYKNNNWYMSDVATSGDNLIISKYHDGAYKTANGAMVDNLLKLATLGQGVEFVEIAKYNLAYNYKVVSRYPMGYDSMVFNYLKAQKEYVSIKHNKKTLIAKDNNGDFKPYKLLLKKVEDNTNGEFLLCTSDRCFAIDKDFDKIKDKINNH